MEKIKVNDIAQLVNGRVSGQADLEIDGVESLKEATSSQLSFFSDQAFKKDFENTQAGAVIVGQEEMVHHSTLIHVDDPSGAFDQLIERWFEGPPTIKPGIDETAIISPTAIVDPTAAIGPYCVIGDHAIVGPGAVLYSHVVIHDHARVGGQSVIWPFVCIRERCVVGESCLIHSGVVIGFDGFGFNNVQGKWIKIPQRGVVVIEDEVEVGANVTIARARFGQTRIGQGTKIDADAHIGHNVKIGKNVYVGAMSGFAGTTTIGDYCVFAPQSGSVPQVTIASGVTFAGRTVATKDLERGVYWGFPALAQDEEKRRILATRQLSQIKNEIKMLRKKIEDLENTKNN